MSNENNLGTKLAGNLEEFARELSMEIAAYATLMRTGPVVTPRTANVPVSEHEYFRTAQVLAVVVMELMEGDIEDLYQHLDSYVNAKHTARMVAAKRRATAGMN